MTGFYADRSAFAGTGEFMPSPDVAIADVPRLSSGGSSGCAHAGR
jgi:hypothetical protein